MNRRNANDAMAYAIASMGRDRVDKFGHPYVIHLMQVATAVFMACSVAGIENADELVQAAILHDTVEDTSTTLADLRDYGFSDSVVDMVDGLTKREGESYVEFLFRARTAGDNVSIIKAADVSSNFSPYRIRGEIDTPANRERMYRYACAMQFFESESDVEAAGALMALDGIYGPNAPGKRFVFAFIEHMAKEHGQPAEQTASMVAAEANLIQTCSIKQVEQALKEAAEFRQRAQEAAKESPRE